MEVRKSMIWIRFQRCKGDVDFRIEVKRYELEELFGYEKMMSLYEAVKHNGKIPEMSDDVNEKFNDLINLENFYFNS